LRQQRFDIVCNCACLHTADCEKFPSGAHSVNSLGSGNVAQVAREYDALLVQISTDQVFDGTKPRPETYTEDDEPNPQSLYGITKHGGELNIAGVGGKYQIYRTTCLFGVSPTRGKPNGDNFVEMILRRARMGNILEVVNDQFTTPTSTASLAKQIVVMSEVKEYGIFHAVGQGSVSWYDFAGAILDGTKTPARLVATQTPAGGIKRGRNLVMENRRLQGLKLDQFKHWRDELGGYLNVRAENNSGK
jgi:dTDP-4-dehydrorhamnose reductase